MQQTTRNMRQILNTTSRLSSRSRTENRGWKMLRVMPYTLLHPSNPHREAPRSCSNQRHAILHITAHTNTHVNQHIQCSRRNRAHIIILALHHSNQHIHTIRRNDLPSLRITSPSKTHLLRRSRTNQIAQEEHKLLKQSLILSIVFHHRDYPLTHAARHHTLNHAFVRRHDIRPR